MALVIDCYNLLHQPMPPGLAGLDEWGLVRALERAGWTAQGVVIVCDGNPKPHFAVRQPAPGVRVVYAGKEQSADDVIAAMLNAHSAPRRVTLVSDDRALRKTARRRGVLAQSCATFIHELLLALTQDTGAAPATEDRPPANLAEDSDAVRRWAQAFGVDPDTPIK